MRITKIGCEVRIDFSSILRSNEEIPSENPVEKHEFTLLVREEAPCVILVDWCR